MEEGPEKVVELAVKGMLKRLHVSADENHKYEAQQPTPLPLK